LIVPLTLNRSVLNLFSSALEIANTVDTYVKADSVIALVDSLSSVQKTTFPFHVVHFGCVFYEELAGCYFRWNINKSVREEFFEVHAFCHHNFDVGILPSVFIEG
jgi:hypothetical protein